jgi:putative DNA primase/helicase
MMTAREAAARLGGQATSPASLICPGPGHSQRDRSLSVRFVPDAPDGFVVHSFPGDDPLACRDHVRAALGLGLWQPRRTEPAPRPRPAPPDDEASRVSAALRLWREAGDAKGTLAERYLASRGLELDDRARRVLRFHPRLRFDGREVPGLVALLSDLRTDEPCGIHRTFLGPDAAKLDRRMLGRARGAAIKLDPDDEVTLGLVIAEGVESALAARMLGYRPTWAVGSAGAIGNLPVLPGIEGLTILGEDDAASAREARKCARRWIEAGADVSLLEPIGGGDANDVLRRTA